MEAMTNTDFMPIPIFKKGKVRDIYEVEDNLLIISTDRVSAFDVILNEGVPGKGGVLNSLTEFWFEKTADIIQNHFITCDMNELPGEFDEVKHLLQGRSMLVYKADPFPVECVARGYLAGSGWKEYKKNNTISEIALPPGLEQAEQLPAPIFTPSTKAEIGEHDENIGFNAVVKELGESVAREIKRVSLDLYRRGSEIANEKGIILADTKFEFGLFEGEMMLIDEIFTPDSSRFWPADKYEPGHDQENLDKQFLRDWLETLDWDKKPPPPELPEDTIRNTAKRYKYIENILLG
ncbi:MAG: phosphoribosylaminoimidazolesuccinocarboxamide synthase [Actinobacteria bacterium]|nr:phosphoribosylaminoimidazolesuccinocarboxamide synthase [Actinomycetota bacterium]